MLSRGLLFGLGFLALLAGGMLAVLWFTQTGGSTPSAAEPIPTRTILVAARAIPTGTLLRPSDMKWEAVPGSGITTDDIVRGAATETDFNGAVTRRAFTAHEPMTSTAMVKQGDAEFLVAALGPGFRAVSIAVDATQSTSGLVLPGDRVDIVLTQTFAVAGTDAGHKSAGETILRDLRVIAVDQKLSSPPSSAPAAPGADPKMPKTITLEVTQRQAEQLLVAEQLGKIQLALRGQRDRDAAPATAGNDNSPTWASDVSDALGKPRPLSSGGAHGTIDVIRGDKIERRCVTDAGLITCP